MLDTGMLSHCTSFTAILIGISIFHKQTDRHRDREKPVFLMCENKKETQHLALNFEKKIHIHYTSNKSYNKKYTHYYLTSINIHI
jgi:hypothetical protein